jgi:RHS repeat-associated protein
LIQNSYDTASRLTSLKVNGAEQAGDIIYNAADETTSIKIGGAGANQVTENYTFDPQTGLLTNQTAIRNNQTLVDMSYEYNRAGSVGNLNGKTGHLSKIIDNLNQNKNREYEYDALGRLTKAKGGTNNLWTQQYAYDRYGNRTSVTASGVAADNTSIPSDGIANLAYNSTTNRITTNGFEYDGAGNQIRALSEDGQTFVRYEYDAANRLRIIKKDDGTLLQSYMYGATNARIFGSDHVSNQLTVYATLGGTTLSEYVEHTSAVPTWTKSYVFMGERLLSTITPNGVGGEFVEFSHPDRLGTRLITNQAGGSYEQTTLPFGTALNAESTGSINRRFTSYDRSAVTGLDYAINRTYDSKQGRFTQVDPIGVKASKLELPQTLNLYAYCGNDPINYTDPDGLFFGSLFKWIGKVFNSIGNAIKFVAAKVARFVVAALTSVHNDMVLNILRMVGQIPVIGPFIQTVGTLAYLGYLLATGQGWAFVRAVAGLYIQAFIDGVVGTVVESIKSEVKKHGFLVGLFRGVGKAFKYTASALLGRGLRGIGPVYGFFCGSKWGTDGITANETPIDDVDAACRSHDLEMERIKREISDSKQRARAKLRADSVFMRRILLSRSRNPRAGAFRPIAILGFAVRDMKLLILKRA